MRSFRRALTAIAATMLVATAAGARVEASPQRTASAAAPPATASADRAQLVLADGRRIDVSRVLPSGDRRAVEWRRPDGDRDESAAFGEVVAILWIDRAPIGEARPSIAMQNGERFPGRLDRAEGTLRWMHPWLGAISIDLERTRSISIEGAASSETSDPNAEADRVRLANGDRIEGLVTELDREVAIESLADGSVRRVPLEVVARLDFLESKQAPGAIRFEARDGTVVDVASFRTSPPSLREATRRGEAATIDLVRSGDQPGSSRPSITLPLEDFAALLLAPSRIELLASMVPTVEAIDGSERLWLPSPRSADSTAPIASRDVEISGPVRVRYRVAKGSVLSAIATLPDTMRRFGDFEMRVLDGSREVLRHRFSREDPSIAIAAPIDTGELVIELREGLHGPVQDRLLLESPMLIAPRP